jgi:ubiquinone/menaquinone biosynthesis C-methylase UbiE
MKHEMTEEQLKELAAQLSCPAGEEGLKLAEMMHGNNIGMTTAAIETLGIGNGDRILELGHGNAAHVAKILEAGANVNYTGLEISEDMHREGQRQNAEAISGGRAEFALYDGSHIPFAGHSFDGILTVNTIYFWEDHLQLLQEIFRVLKPGGIVALAYAQKEFMRHLPFTKYGFTLFGDDEIAKLVGRTGFTLEGISAHEEQVTTKAGDLVTRQFSVAKITK